MSCLRCLGDCVSAATVASVGALIHSHPRLLPLLDEHLLDNDGEVLPYLVLADIVRWLVDHEQTDPEFCRSVLNWLEREFLAGSDDVQTLIALGGVEMIPDPGKPGATLRAWLGPSLTAVDPWSRR